MMVTYQTSFSLSVLLFVSPTCPHCRTAERIFREIIKERSDVRGEIVSTSSPYGRRLSKKFDIMSVPTMVIITPDEEYIGLRGAYSKKYLNKFFDKIISRKIKKTKP